MKWVRKKRTRLTHPGRWWKEPACAVTLRPNIRNFTHRFAKYCNMAKCPRCGGLYDPAKMTVCFSLLLLVVSHGKATMVGASMGRIKRKLISISATTTNTIPTIPRMATAPVSSSKNATIIIRSWMCTFQHKKLWNEWYRARAFWN